VTAGDVPRYDRIAFDLPLPPRPLRRNSLTRHYGYRARLVREYQEQVWCAASASVAPGMPWSRARVRYVWHSTHPTDADNIIATMKPALDVLKATGPRPVGVVLDDGPGVEVQAEWRKARSRSEERVRVEVERLPYEQEISAHDNGGLSHRHAVRLDMPEHEH
jgi:hypothetical protein